MSPPRTYRLFVGIDVGATTFTAAWVPSRGPPSKPIPLPHTPAGYPQLDQPLASTEIPPSEILVVLEATSS